MQAFEKCNTFNRCRLDDLICALGGFALEGYPRLTKLEQVRDLCREGKSNREIAELVNSPVTSIRAMVSTHRLRGEVRVYRPWSKTDIAMLMQLRYDNTPYKKIARILNRSAGTCIVRYGKIQKSLRPALGSSLRAA